VFSPFRCFRLLFAFSLFLFSYLYLFMSYSFPCSFLFACHIFLPIFFFLSTLHLYIISSSLPPNYFLQFSPLPVSPSLVLCSENTHSGVETILIKQLFRRRRCDLSVFVLWRSTDLKREEIDEIKRYMQRLKDERIAISIASARRCAHRRLGMGPTKRAVSAGKTAA